VNKAFETCHDKEVDVRPHRHTSAYLALVLDGVYEERSVDGRYNLRPGMLVYHPPFHAHANAFISDEVRVLNVELEVSEQLLSRYRVAPISNSDVFERLMHSQPAQTIEAATEVFGALSHRSEPTPRWIAVLARALAMESDPRPIKTLVRRLGVSPEHASRRFQKEFGVGPSIFRNEQRLRKAITALASGATLANAAVDAGYADQSHMGRAVKEAIGLTPGDFRRQSTSAK